MRHKNSYYIKQLKSGNYHVCLLSNNLPIYDKEPDGNDAPLVFKDEDAAIEYRDYLNKTINDETETINLFQSRIRN